MTNTNESGRSMVEMLGVLAIIGVLSVMGIAGYTQAMKRYRANEAASEIAMGAMLCATQKSATGLDTTYMTLDCNDSTTVTYSIKTGQNVDESMVEAMFEGKPGFSASANTYQIIS